MDSITKKNLIKDLIQELSLEMFGEKYNVAGDFNDKLNESIKISLIKEALRRCQANGRKTVGARDL